MSGFDQIRMGNNISRKRNERGFSQQYVADQLGIKRTSFIAVEQGNHQLKGDAIVQLADMFGTTCDYILRGTETENLDVQKELGLSNDAIEYLKCINKQTDGIGLKLINTILEKNFREIINAIVEYLTTDYSAPDFVDFIDNNDSKELITLPLDKSLLYFKSTLDNSEVPLYLKNTHFEEIMLESIKQIIREAKNSKNRNISWLTPSIDVINYDIEVAKHLKNHKEVSENEEA